MRFCDFLLDQISQMRVLCQIILYAGGRLVLAKEMTVGELTGFLLYVIFVAAR